MYNLNPLHLGSFQNDLMSASGLDRESLRLLDIHVIRNLATTGDIDPTFCRDLRLEAAKSPSSSNGFKGALPSL